MKLPHDPIRMIATSASILNNKGWMKKTRTRILTVAIAACAITFGAGCVTEEVSQTVPPYATISDADRDPASAPRSSNADTGDSGGVMSTIGDAIMWPFRTIGEAFSSK
jgi:hypothetical protein